MIFSDKIIKGYSKTLLTRRDPDLAVKFFDAEDFPGLSKSGVVFKNASGETLHGYIYSYPDHKTDRLVIFDHGMGAGHRAYMTEIATLASHGYRVFSYDHTGCGESEGQGIKGFSGSLSDLDCAVRAIRSSEEYAKIKLTVVGHSWGAFSTMNITAIHKDIESIVAMSGFISVQSIQQEKIRGILSLWRKDLYSLEAKVNPNYYAYNAIDTLSKTEARALIIHSEDDPIVGFDKNFGKLLGALSGRSRISFLSVNGKRHSPNYTFEAVKYKDEYFAELNTMRKKKKFKTDEQRKAFADSYDWRKMTEQDEKLWQIIFDHIDAVND